MFQQAPYLAGCQRGDAVKSGVIVAPDGDIVAPHIITDNVAVHFIGAVPPDLDTWSPRVT